MSTIPRFRTVANRVHLLNLSPASNSQHHQKRVGRGQGSGYGGTSGRGHKGQKARSGNGKPKPGFEGGQVPITRLFPKKGFVNPNAKVYAPINLDRIQHWIDQGRLQSSPDKPITARELLLSGCIHDAHDGIKLLGDGAQHLKTPIHVVSSKASKSAIKAVEKVGGYVFCQYYNALALRDCLKGRTDRTSAAPIKRNDIMWYTEWRNRGYLSPEALKKMPAAIVEDRWTALSDQLRLYKSQSFDKQ